LIVDTSALVAIAKGEPEAKRCIQRLEEFGRNRISAANLFEAFLVVDRLPAAGSRDIVEALWNRFALQVEPITEQHVRLAREANLRYGKGSGNGAGLNFGDCFAYALAKQTGEPLLFVGNDFGKTDIGVA